MATGRSGFGPRLDGAYQKFCPSLCDEEAEDLDIGYRFLNANLNGILEYPLGTNASLRPYMMAGVGIYDYELAGDDAPEGVESRPTSDSTAGSG